MTREYKPLSVRDLRGAIEELPDDMLVTLLYDGGFGEGDLLDIGVLEGKLCLGTT